MRTFPYDVIQAPYQAISMDRKHYLSKDARRYASCRAGGLSIKSYTELPHDEYRRP